MRTFTASQLRDPDVLAQAALAPVGIFDGKRATEMVLGPKTMWETGHRLLDCSLLLANAVVELPDDRPSRTALGALGFAADWSLSDRQWLLGQLAEAYAESVRLDSTAPMEDFVRFVSLPDSGQSSRLAAPVAPEDLPMSFPGRLRLRSD